MWDKMQGLGHVPAPAPRWPARRPIQDSAVVGNQVVSDKAADQLGGTASQPCSHTVVTAAMQSSTTDLLQLLAAVSRQAAAQHVRQ